MNSANLFLRLLALATVVTVARCDTDCSGGPVPIPEEEEVQLFLLRLQAEEEVSLPSISKAEALGNLGAEFLEQDTIQGLADKSDAFFEIQAAALSPIASRVCNLPLAKSCEIQRCGCNPDAPSARRKLLICYGSRMWRCASRTFGRTGKMNSTPAADNSANSVNFTIVTDASSNHPSIASGNVNSLGIGRKLSYFSRRSAKEASNLAVGLCVGGRCILFKISTSESMSLLATMDSTCPGLSKQRITPGMTIRKTG